MNNLMLRQVATVRTFLLNFVWMCLFIYQSMGLAHAATMVWQTDSDGETVTLPLIDGGNYNFTVDWGDGSGIDTITVWNQAEVTHTYASSGSYTVTFSGTLEGFAFNNGGGVVKLREISDWGTIRLSHNGYVGGGYFYGASQLDITATTAPDMTFMTSMANAFRDSGIDDSGNLNSWDVSGVTDMSSMFEGATQFNQALSGWDISSVTNLTDFLNGVTLATEHYDAMLQAWDALELQDGLNFNAGNVRYSLGEAETSRNSIIATDTWTITDGGSTVFWDNGGGDQNFSTAANWNNDTAIDANSHVTLGSESGALTWDSPTTLDGLTLETGFTGQLSSAADTDLSVTNALVLSGGTLSTDAVITVNTLTQQNGSVLTLALDSLNDGEYARINVVGTATLNGELVITESINEVAGARFNIFDWNSLAAGSQFQNITLPTLAEGLAWDLSALYLAGEIAIVEVPGSVSPMMWLDADDVGTIQISSGDRVGSWFDKSGRNVHVRQAESAHQPILQIDERQYRNSVEFAGSGDILQAGDVFHESTNSGVTLIMVAKTNATGHEHPIYDFGRYPESGIGFSITADDALRFYTPNNHGGATSFSPVKSQLMELNLFSNVVNFENDQKSYLNGVLESAMTESITLSRISNTEINRNSVSVSGAGPVSIGGQSKVFARENNNRYLEGDLYEVLVFDTALTDQQRGEVEAYLELKYNGPEPAFSISDDFNDNQSSGYQGWVGDTDYYVEQNNRLEYSGELANGEHPHVILNETRVDTSVSNISIAVDACATDSVGSLYLYFLYEDSDNWYRLGSAQGAGGRYSLDRSVDGVVSVLGSGDGVGLPPLCGDATFTFLVDLDLLNDSINITLNGSLIATVAEPLTITADNNGFGLGGAARRPVWDNFQVTTTGGEEGRPLLSSTVPEHNAVGISTTSDIVLTFNETIQAGSGNIVLTDSSDGSDTRTIAVSDAQITINNQTLTIDLSTPLELGTQYAVTLAEGVLLDSENQPFLGITSSELNFTTVEVEMTLQGQFEPLYSVGVGSQFQLSPPGVTLSPQEGTVTYSLDTDAGWATVDANTGVIVGTPSQLGIGQYSFTLRAHAGTASSAFDPFLVSVIVDETLEPGTESYTSQLGLSSVVFTDSGSNAAVSSSNGSAINPIIQTNQDGQNGQTASDTTPPTFTVTDITRSASGFLTSLSLTPPTAQDNVDGSLSANLIAPQSGYRSGSHALYWEATDSAGNTSFVEQTVTLYPIPSFVRLPTFVPEGVEAALAIKLSGESPAYPVQFTVQVGGSATAGVDHTLASGTYTLESGTELTIPYSVLSDQIEESDETIQIDVSVTSGQYHLGQLNAPMVTITESNIPPAASFQMSQDGNERLIVSKSGGIATIDLSIIDPNPSDTHSVEWSIPVGLGATVVSDSQVTLQPMGNALVGPYQLNASITDSAAEPITVDKELAFLLVEAVPLQSDSLDSDGDGVVDSVDGIGDLDQDYVPDLLDNNSQPHILSMDLVWLNSFLLEAETGITLLAEVDALLASQVGAYIPPQGYQILSLFFNLPARSFDETDTLVAFTMTGLSYPGESALVSIPLLEPLPEIYSVQTLSSTSSWQHFVEDSNNQLYGTSGAEGICPEPTPYRYKPSLTLGDHCLMLEVQDGGANDRDGIANGKISIMLGVESGASASLLASNRLSDAEVVSDTEALMGNEREKGEREKGGAISFKGLVALMIGLLILRVGFQAQIRISSNTHKKGCVTL